MKSRNTDLKKRISGKSHSNGIKVTEKTKQAKNRIRESAKKHYEKVKSKRFL